MGAAILGRYTRVRWRFASPKILTQLEAHGTTSLDAEALLVGTDEDWGLIPGQLALLTGADTVGSAAENILRIQYHPTVNHRVAVPSAGTWFVGIEQSASMWAALRGVDITTPNEILFDWRAVDLPGAGPLILGQPIRGGHPFRLVAPPPYNDAFPARLDGDNVLITTPFCPEEDEGDKPVPTQMDQLDHYLDGICHNVTPRYRYGLIIDGVMHWLDIKPDVRLATATPVTTLLRERLALFQRELAARGIYYEDDANEKGYELRFAIEDGAVPPSFHEPGAALAFTVSGEGKPEEDKYEQARQLYDPEDDWDTGKSYAIDYPTMPARVDVNGTRLIFLSSGHAEVGGVAVDDAWAEAHLESAGIAAGLDVGASFYPALTIADRARLESAAEPTLITWNAVDAADRVQCAAYALATGGAIDSAFEAHLSSLRGPIVQILLGRNALTAAKAGDLDEARAIVARLPPLAPGPFPRRAYAVIELADGLADQVRRARLVDDAIQAVHDPLERQLAQLLADSIASVGHAASCGAADWSENGTYDIRRWIEEIAKAFRGP